MPSSLRRSDVGVQRHATIDLKSIDETIRVNLRRVTGAKRFTLRVRMATRDVVLTIPYRASISSAREFAERHVAWIGARVRRLPRPVLFEPGIIIPVGGESHTIEHRPSAQGGVWIEQAPGDGLTPEWRLCVSGHAEHVPRRVADFLRREAQRRLRDAVQAHAGRIDVTIRRISVRDTTSRWGSCSVSGALSFSWRLILAPHFVLDYLAAHEVAHRVHLDHSPKFWALTRSLAPATDRAEAWLKAHGAELHRYGAD